MVAIGNKTNDTITQISQAKRISNMHKSAIIKKVFIAMPIALEKPTSPWRYSLFRGWK